MPVLSPRRVKYRKSQRGRMKGESKGGKEISFGTYALISCSCKAINARQIEAARVAINRKVKRGGKLWIRIFPDKPMSKKPAETRMGKGKGETDEWVAIVKPGRVLFEIAGVEEVLAKEAMLAASHKLPVRTKFGKRKEVEDAVK